MSLVEIERHFTVRSVGSGRCELHQRADAVMEQLVVLSDSGIILDSLMAVDTAEKSVVITVTVEHDDFTEAVITGMTAMRNAIHSAGDATPGWPSNKALIEAVNNTMSAQLIPA